MSRGQKRSPEKPASGPQPFECQPIYRMALEVLREIHVIAARMSKAYKYTLGQDLSRASLLLAETVALAYIENVVLKKIALLNAVEKRCVRVLILHRLADAVQAIERTRYIENVERIVAIIRQARGWRKSVADKAADSSGDGSAGQSVARP